MGGESKYEISQNAYMKLLLHALKHNSASVNGVLVGRVNPKNDVIQFVDAVPLFHSNLALLPPLEIALLMVRFLGSASSFPASSIGLALELIAK